MDVCAPAHGFCQDFDNFDPSPRIDICRISALRFELRFVPHRMDLSLLCRTNQSVVLACIEAMVVPVAATLYLDKFSLSTAKTNNLSQKETQNSPSQSFPSEPKLHWNGIEISECTGHLHLKKRKMRTSAPSFLNPSFSQLFWIFGPRFGQDHCQDEVYN